MIFSEKITELRKRSGLSQEQFGDRIGVSRQAVSKWEMAQSVPDITRVMAIADLFGVPVDFLLKDEYGPEDLGDMPVPKEGQQKMITLEETQAYFQEKKNAAKQLIAAVFLFFLSPLPGIALSLTGDGRKGIVGAMIQVIVLASAAVTVLSARQKTSRFRYFREDGRELAYGVKGAAEARRKEFEHVRSSGIIIGAGLIVLSVLPMMICAVFTDTGDAAILVSGAAMLLLFAGGVSLILYVSLVSSGFVKIRDHK